jgi:hypothetical protein
MPGVHASAGDGVPESYAD